eukprot:Tbor_TRINITY_DN5832_c4_g1::TRINITY_DN5832_c4_g1_i1::g.6045::m.6045
MTKKPLREAYAVVCCMSNRGFIVRVISREEDDIDVTITAEQDNQQKKKNKVTINYGNVVRVDTTDADNGTGTADILEVVSEKDVHSLERKGEIHPRVKWENYVGKSAKDRIQEMKLLAHERDLSNENDCEVDVSNEECDDESKPHSKGTKKSLSRAEKRELHEQGVRGYNGNRSGGSIPSTSNTNSPSLLAKSAMMDEKLGDALLDDL